MGNCLRHEESSSSSSNWAGEDWGSLVDDYDRLDHKKIRKAKKRMEDDEDGKFGLGTGNKLNLDGGASEVKIKMTKKELEELMGRVELKQMSVQQVLAQLIITVSNTATSGTDHRYETSDHDHQRPWRPALQSIPEVN